MSAGSDSFTTNTSGALIRPGAVPRVEKPRKTATSRDRDHGPDERRGPQPTRRQAYRFDTVSVPPWNGPMLMSIYAAQVIAQALYEPERKRAAYPQPRVPVALVVDRRL